MILESFEIHGYTAQLLDDYSIRITNPSGKQVKNPTKDIRADPKWKHFLELRNNHEKNITQLKKRVIDKMNCGDFINISAFINATSSFTTGDMENITKGMYVEGTGLNGEKFRGFIDGHDKEHLLVEGKPARSVLFLHPVDIDNIQEIQLRAIREMRITNMLQLFRRVYKPNPDEETCITRFKEIPVRPAQFIAIMSSYGWVARSKEEGNAYKYVEVRGKSYVIKFQMSVDYPLKHVMKLPGQTMVTNEGLKDKFVLGVVEFSQTNLLHEFNPFRPTVSVPKPCRAVDVDPIVFSEVVREIDGAVLKARLDDGVTEDRMFERKETARTFIHALGLTNCELIGDVVKVHGDWGIYGVSLVDARAFWWSNKVFICIQPKCGHESPRFGSFLVGEGGLDDVVLSLAIAKVRALSDDTHPIDDVVDKQIKPSKTTATINGIYTREERSRDGMLLQEVQRQKMELLKKWQ